MISFRKFASSDVKRTHSVWCAHSLTLMGEDTRTASEVRSVMPFYPRHDISRYLARLAELLKAAPAVGVKMISSFFFYFGPKTLKYVTWLRYGVFAPPEADRFEADQKIAGL